MAEFVGWVALFVALPALTLIKIAPHDILWHLGTARLAEGLGHWPTTNSFSFTFADYPLYQQYPVFQAVVHRLYTLGGWPGLSLFLALGWAAVFSLFLRWGGPLRRAAAFHASWILVVLTLQTRMMLRPDLFSLALFAATLLTIDAYRGGRRRALLLLPVIHWLWVNSHQLFVLSFALQGLFLATVLLERKPWRPAAAALLASTLASFLTPLGGRIVQVFAQTSGSLAHHRAHVDELAPVWNTPLWLVLALLVGALAGQALWRRRHERPVLELGVWLLTLALALMAIRGLVYFTLASGAIFQRLTTGRPPIYWRWMAAGLSLVAAAAVVQHRWIQPPLTLHGIQPGIGRTEGAWPDQAIAHLRAHPPSGKMMNMPWSLGAPLIWLWPEQKVFVDPRFEAYPRQFLLANMAAYTDGHALERLTDAHAVGWIFAAHCDRDIRARLAELVAGGGWQPTYADALTAVLVRRETARAWTPGAEPADLVSGPEALQAEQRLCYRQLLEALGR